MKVKTDVRREVPRGKGVRGWFRVVSPDLPRGGVEVGSRPRPILRPFTYN